jgi:hypothetical protein
MVIFLQALELFQAVPDVGAADDISNCLAILELYIADAAS